MKGKDLDLRELLDFAPEGGVLRFAGRRVLLLDPVVLGILRAELIETIGLTAARGLMTRLGYAHGWRTAELMKDAFPWDSERDWRAAGGRLHTLQGLVTVEPIPEDASGSNVFAQAIWRDSFEAEQHLLHLGVAEEPVCWTLTGFASGYLSYANGKPVFCLETRCVGKGDAVCRVEGKSREEWGAEIEPHLPFYRKACLDSSLSQLTDALKRTERKLKSRRAQLGDKGADDSGGIIVRSARMQRALDLARRVAKVDSTVLVTGESGVGKERIARMIHDESARAARPFIALNCGAVTESLLESELFGYIKGAFTGATQDRAGIFEAASGGTLLLDEIGEISQAMQVRLLRALQEREIRRVGDNAVRRIDVRVIAATNRKLSDEVAAGRFRQDLYYRLRVVEIEVPPLRERREDLLTLARVLLSEAAERAGRKVTGFTPRAANQLMQYLWPGNVRELENVMQHAIVMLDEDDVRVDVEHLPDEVRSLTGATSRAARGVRALEEVEREHILQVVRLSGGNRAKAAEQLGIGTATLFRKLKQYSAEEQ